MAWSDAPLVSAFEDGVCRNEMAVLEDAHLGCERVDLDVASACRVGNAVGIAPDADHTVPGDPPLQPQHRSEGGERKM